MSRLSPAAWPREQGTPTAECGSAPVLEHVVLVAELEFRSLVTRFFKFPYFRGLVAVRIGAANLFEAHVFLAFSGLYNPEKKEETTIISDGFTPLNSITV